MIKFIIGAFLGAIIQNLVARYLRERARLVYYIQSISDHSLPDVLVPVRSPSLMESNPPTRPLQIFTHSITIRNNGNRVANNVEVIHTTFLPRYITVTPFDINHTIDRQHRIIRFDSIVPQQQITIGYLDSVAYTYQDILNTVVRSNEGFARPLAMTQYPIMSRWFNRMVWILLVLGILTVIFIIYKLSPYIVNTIFRIFNKITS